MHPDVLQRWCDPKTILAVAGPDDGTPLMFHAITEARRSGARLLLAQNLPAIYRSKGARTERSLFPSTRGESASFYDIAIRLQWQGVLCEPVALRGTGMEEIASLVRSQNVDRVFLAEPPDSAEHPFQSDLVAHLMSSLEVPVCVIGRHMQGETTDRRVPGRILLAHSLQSQERLLVSLACGLAIRRHAHLTLLHVIEAANMSEEQRVHAHNIARARLSALVASRIDLPRSPEITIREGDAAAQILEEELCPCRDLVILGPASARADMSLWRESIVHRVIAESRCPVLAVGAAAAACEAGSISEPALKTGSLDR